MVEDCLLQQTRIGKYVNEMRRKTADRNLARRAKDLVRKWQQLIGSQSSSFPPSASVANPSTGEITRVASSGSLVDAGTAALPTNGIHSLPHRSSNGSNTRLPTSEYVSSEKQLYRDASGSRYQPSRGKISSSAEKSSVRSSQASSQPSTPITVANFQPTTFSSLSRPATPSSVYFRSQTPSPQMSTASVKLQAAAAATNSSKLSPMYSHCVTNGTESATGAGLLSKLKPSGSTDALMDVKGKYANGRNGLLKSSSSTSNLVCNGVWTVHSSADADNNATERMTTSPDPLRADAPLARLKIKINRPPAGGSVSSPVAESPATIPSSAARKTQKVATTAELIQRLHANGELRLVASDTLNRIATNQIEHEADDSNVSIVPEGAKPRPHKRRRMERLPDQLPPAMTDKDLLQVKAERVRNFVQMSADVSPTAGDNDLLGLLGRLPQPASATVTADTIQSAEPEVVPAVRVSADRELPSLTDFEIDWDSNTYTVPDTRPPPTDVDVDHLLNEQWPSVNGQYDNRGEWTDWTQSYSAHSYNGSLIHILPYVDIDD